MSRGREFEEERRLSREEVGRILQEIGRRLEDEGVVSVRDREARVPDEVDLELELERGRYGVEFEVELEWGLDEVSGDPIYPVGEDEGSLSGDAPADLGVDSERSVSAPSPGSFLEYRPGFDETKCRMEDLVRGFEGEAESGVLPSVDEFREFLALNALFEEYAEGESYGHMMPAYGEAVEEMVEAFESGEPESFLGALREVRSEEDRCHGRYR